MQPVFNFSIKYSHQLSPFNNSYSICSVFFLTDNVLYILLLFRKQQIWKNSFFLSTHKISIRIILTFYEELMTAFIKKLTILFPSPTVNVRTQTKGDFVLRRLTGSGSNHCICMQLYKDNRWVIPPFLFALYN